MRHFLQSDEWADFQQERGLRSVEIGDTKAFIERSHGKLGRLFSRLYAPYGPTVANPKLLAKTLEVIETSANEYGVDAVRIEPVGEIDETELLHAGYKKRAKSSQPEHTRILTLKNKSIDQVVGEMNATNRNLWRKNERSHQIEFRIEYKSETINPFLTMMHETAKRSGAVFHSSQYFRTLIDTLGPKKAAGVVIASVEGKDMASAMFAVDRIAKTLHYLHAGSTYDARTYSVGNVLVAKLIVLACEWGMEYVDLFGIAPEDATRDHPLYGISKFKRSYGGEDVAYHGTWEKSLSVKHRVMKVLRRS